MLRRGGHPPQGRRQRLARTPSDVVTRIGEREAVEIAVFREAGANIVQLVDAVRARLRQRGAAGLGQERAGKPGAQDTFGDRR